jgi:phage terminase small subunit
MNDRQKKFAQNVSLGMTLKDAYVAAGYSASNADKNATKLRKKPAVDGYLRELAGQAEAKVVNLTAEQRVNYDRVTQLLDDMVNVSIADYMREGHFIPTEEWTPAMRAAGVGFKVRRIQPRLKQHCDECGHEHAVEEHIFEITLPKKDHLVELLGKLRHVGAFVNITHNPSDGEWEDWLAEREKEGEA